jgi:hypothetical protein
VFAFHCTMPHWCAARPRTRASPNRNTAANLLMRGLHVEAQERFPVALERLEAAVEALTKVGKEAIALNGSDRSRALNGLPSELRAFMIEVLLLLRYLTKNDLRLGGEIGRKLQKAVGEVRVEGT